MLEHTCIKDDGGTPNRRCYACDMEATNKRPCRCRTIGEHCEICDPNFFGVAEDKFDNFPPTVMGIITDIENSRFDFPLELTQDVMILTKSEIELLAAHLRNEYLTQEEPVRSLLLKIYQFAESK